MLAVIDQIREKTGMPYQAICSAVRLPYPSFIRWRMRRKKDTPLVRQPGPPKVKPPDLGRLQQDIAAVISRAESHAGHGCIIRALRVLLCHGESCREWWRWRGMISIRSIVRICGASAGTCRTSRGPWTPANTNSVTQPAPRCT